MPTEQSKPLQTPADENYAQAYAAWQHALDNYLRLAREEASAGKLRAAAVHAAALAKGRLANPAK